MNKISYKYVRELFDYQNGCLIWRINKSQNTKTGREAGCIGTDGYKVVRIDGKGYKAHRLVFCWHNGYFSENQIDHIDRNKLNNNIKNLREVSQSCNLKNSKIQKNNKSGITGVIWYEGHKKWRAYIQIKNRKVLWLGSFCSKYDAAVARYNAEQKHNYLCHTGDSTAKKYIDKIKGMK